MKFRYLLVFAAVFLALAGTAFAQGGGKSCDINGTWYGGSDDNFQYLWTISPISDGRHSVVVQGALDFRQWGYTYWTTFSGEITKTGARDYESHAMSYLVWDPAAVPDGVDPKVPEVDIEHSRIRFPDCNTMIATFDVYGGYPNFTSQVTPFVTPLVWDYLGGEKIVETYHRMPTVRQHQHDR